MRKTHQDRIDSLISHFWRDGYLTISRKYGTYLPAPAPVGNYEVDAVGKYKKTYVLGITITQEDLNNPKIISKLSYLSSQNTKFSSRKVKLYIGVEKNLVHELNAVISNLPQENRDNIRIMVIN